ncbi:hypothetical protein L1987_46534 [Smallanthus sonchifolius]|uniref:Uncharacterized protein n=1 Tax=Smallanthus sonchifolius TaxID=185202 RepID=A0ACB9G045_9ASTR|nr:hypothetical protein L1987_46534 [Smallanthus sonchifolius]
MVHGVHGGVHTRFLFFWQWRAMPINRRNGDECLVKVHDIQCIEHMLEICDKEGFHNVKFSCIGGAWVLLEFKAPSDVLKFQACEGMKVFFQQPSNG